GFPGSLTVVEAETGIAVATIDPGTTHDYRDVAWDSVGNVYGVDNAQSVWRAFSPPGANDSTTVAPQTVRLGGPSLLSNPSFSNGTFQFMLTGETNRSYTIFSSTNLINWTPASEILCT